MLNSVEHIDFLAREFLPAILEFDRSEEGQREFAEWKTKRAEKQLDKKLNNKESE